MDTPQVRKKQQAKEKAKNKGKIYSQKHIRLLTEQRERFAQNLDHPTKGP